MLHICLYISDIETCSTSEGNNSFRLYMLRNVCVRLSIAAWGKRLTYTQTAYCRDQKEDWDQAVVFDCCLIGQRERQKQSLHPVLSQRCRPNTMSAMHIQYKLQCSSTQFWCHEEEMKPHGLWVKNLRVDLMTFTWALIKHMEGATHGVNSYWKVYIYYVPSHQHLLRPDLQC